MATAVFSPDEVEETVEAMFAATAPSMADVARRQMVDRRLEEAEELARLEEALAAGVDPHLAAAWINEAQTEVTEALTDRAALAATATAGQTREEPRAMVADSTGLADRLGQVPVGVGAEIHAALGVRLTCDRMD